MVQGLSTAAGGGSKFQELSLMQLIRNVYLESPHQRFGMGLDDSISYGAAYRNANALAWYFQDECGLTPESTVVFSFPNLIITPVIMAAVQLCGARMAMFSHRLEQEEFERATHLVKPDVLIMSSPDACLQAHQVAPNARVFAAGCPSAPVPLIEDLIQASGFDEDRSFPNCSAESPIIVFSSGSTGVPKAIVNKASSFGLNGRALRKAFSIERDDVLYVPVPMNHVFGIVGIYATLVSGASFVTSARYHPEEACTLIDTTGATMHLGVSTMFLRELRAMESGAWSLQSLRTGLVAGAGCPPQVIFEFEERFGCRLMQSYGMSETAATLTVTPLELSAEERAATVGFCIEGAQAKLLPGTDEIACKSASMMMGVLQEDGSLKLDLDEDGWFHTGDVGKLDANGMFSIVGRLKDMIIRGGINIFPAEIEAAYEQNEDISSCCVVGCPDDDLGERTCLCVTMKPGDQTSARDLRLWSKGRIEKCKMPDYVLKMKEFPLLGNGKIDKRALRQQVRACLRGARSE